MKNFSFKILAKDKMNKARTGIISTPHGEIETPAFVPVGTLGAVKSLTPEEVRKTGSQVLLSNTYHLYLKPGDENIAKLGGLHKFMDWDGPIVTDSGGFQVFSLGLANKIFNSHKDRLMTKINDEGVIFHSHLDGTIHQFTPEKSIKVQENLGSDIMIAFDHCPPFPSEYKYVADAVRRTLLWAKRCQKVQKYPDKQALYGVIQGGVYQALREKSAKDIVSLNFPGLAVGGVAVGENKTDMYQVVSWVSPFLPENIPIHLLGVGDIDDFFNCLEWGIDTFDCVSPTRLGRMGQFYTNDKKIWGTKKWQADIFKSKFFLDSLPLDTKCDCYACLHYTRAYLHHLFRCEDLLGYRMLSLHNITFLQKLMFEIRSALKNNQFNALKKYWLS